MTKLYLFIRTEFTERDLSRNSFFLSVISLYYLIVAFYSTGYHHFDEHYQIIEFANFKLGNASVVDLAWEFSAKVRSGLQPALCFLILKSCHLISITDPYDIAFILRALTSIFAVFTIRFFIISFFPMIENGYRNYFVLTSYLLWFLPYVNVRFSSETWSGLFFLIAVALIHCQGYKETTNIQIVKLGLFLGISILFRYQAIIMVSGLLMWGLFVKNISRKHLALITMVLGLVTCIGTIIDWWLYGELSLSIYNYFYVNIFKDVASQYGISPWYEILYYVVCSPGPIGIFIFLSYLGIFILSPKNIIIWITAPFLVIHSIVPHKELRFLFPLINFVPLILVLGIQYFNSYFTEIKLYKYKIGFISLILIVNVFGLIVITSRGAGNGKNSLAKFI